jgi:hypothetical protein
MCWSSIILIDNNYIDRELANADEKEQFEVQKAEKKLITAEKKRVAAVKKQAKINQRIASQNLSI